MQTIKSSNVTTKFDSLPTSKILSLADVTSLTTESHEPN